MPIFEYICMDCRKKTSVFIRSPSDKPDLQCGHCQSINLQRIFSRFAAPKSEETRLERMADPSVWGGVDENNPKSVADFTKRMAREMGDEFPGETGDNYEDMADGEFSGRKSSDAGEPGGTDSGSDAESDAESDSGSGAE